MRANVSWTGTPPSDVLRASSHHAKKPAYTGTPLRMRTVPHVDISSLEHHRSDHIPQTMHPCDPRVLAEQDNKSRQAAARKCVFTYEDKYTFARILVADSLVFDSHFESGNLHSAFRVFAEETRLPTNQHIYDLYMHNDVYTNGHTQWFYFSVTNMRAGDEVTFNIKNFAKSDALFNGGMRPLLYSKKFDKGWVRCGTDIAYFPTALSGPAAAFTQAPQTQVQQPPPPVAPADGATGLAGGVEGASSSSSSAEQTSNADNSGAASKKKAPATPTNFTLTFTHRFEFSDDVCYFAYCHPYTYTDLQNYLCKLEMDERKSRSFRRSVLCKTIAGNNCDVLTVTAPAISADVLLTRVVVFLTARVHPGESNASWIMQGMIDFLTSDLAEAVQLRERFIFKIIPMLNPDGVINGNYRTSLAGVDLNRKWNNPDAAKHPTIYHTKELIRRVKMNWHVALIIDIHGHSRKQGAFFYGCVPDRKLLRPASPSYYAVANRDPSSGDMTPQEVREAETLKAFFATLDSSAALLPSFSDTGNSSSPQQSAAAWTIVNDPLRNAILPTKCVSLRDVLAWRVKLLPRVLDVIAPVFSLESCSFKMHKAKSSTMRMVAFTELGVDCVYTIEASLAGKFPYHFSAGDLINLGREMCTGLLTIYPSLASRTSPLYEAPISLSSTSHAAALSVFLHEMKLWKHLYSMQTCSGSGASLLSEAGLAELTHGNGGDDAGQQHGGDDSDKESVVESGEGSSGAIMSSKMKLKSNSKKKFAVTSAANGETDKPPWQAKKTLRSKKLDRLIVATESSWAFDELGIAYQTSSKDRGSKQASSTATSSAPVSAVGSSRLTHAALPELLSTADLLSTVKALVVGQSLAVKEATDVAVAAKVTKPPKRSKPAPVMQTSTEQVKSGENLRLDAGYALIGSPLKNKSTISGGGVEEFPTKTTQDHVVRIPTVGPTSPVTLSFTRLNAARTVTSSVVPTSPLSAEVARISSPAIAGNAKERNPVPPQSNLAATKEGLFSSRPPRATPPRATKDIRYKPSRLFDIDPLGAAGLPLNGNIIINPGEHFLGGGKAPPHLDDLALSASSRFTRVVAKR